MKKWSTTDIIVLILEIMAPIVSLGITLIWGSNLTEDVKLAIITAGIAIPIAIMQVSVTQGQNKNEKDIEEIKNEVSENLEEIKIWFEENNEKITHISPILEDVFLSNNERIQRFAYRRLHEANKAVKYAIANNRSDILRPNEYYEELFYLADLIKKDYLNVGEKFDGEIWAMTSFAEDEWSADQGYERIWTEKLSELVKQGVNTRRLCIISNDIFSVLQSPTFDLNRTISTNPSFKAFWEFLKLYYKDGCAKNLTQFAIRENDCNRLTRIRGFFAIKLSNGELHILYGETVDSNGAMTSELLFDRREIQDIRDLFDRYSNHAIGEFVEINASQAFKDALTKFNIKMY